MDNFIFQIQSIKSQIDNMKFQISNIEMQYNNMNMQFQGEQLINLGIQMLNTGLNSFNVGMSKAMSSLDTYFIQLQKISDQIINLINTNQNMIQQQMMQQQQFVQQQMMQQQMMQQKMMNQINVQNPCLKKMNIVLKVINPYMHINIQFNYGTKIKEVIEIFSKRIGKPKNDYLFIFNGETLRYNDERKIENVLPDCIVIEAIEKG